MKSPEKTAAAAEIAAARGFDSSDDEDCELDTSPFNVSWLDLSSVGCDEKLGISALPGCRFKETWRSLENDVKQLKTDGVQDVFCLCSKGELNKYRSPWLLHELSAADITVHHYPFPDGQTPSTACLMKLLDELNVCLMNSKKTLIHCFGGLGRSCLVAVCLLMKMDVTLSADSAIEQVRELRGHGAVQSVKQYNFIQDFRKTVEEFNLEEEEAKRSLSR